MQTNPWARTRHLRALMRPRIAPNAAVKDTQAICAPALNFDTNMRQVQKSHNQHFSVTGPFANVNKKIEEHLLGSMVQQVPCGTGGHGFNSHGWLPHLMWTLLEYLCSIWPWWEIAVDYFGDKVVGVAICHILWAQKPFDGCLWIEIGVLCTKSINLCLC